MGYQSSATPSCTSVPDGSTPSGAPGASNAATIMIFPGQGGPMSALPDLTGRGQNNASPRGARGSYFVIDPRFYHYLINLKICFVWKQKKRKLSCQ